MKPYQKYVETNIIKMNGKTNFIDECSKTITDLSIHPLDNLNQIMFFCGVLRYLKRL